MSVLNNFFAKDINVYIQEKIRIAKCRHCKQITKQKNNLSLSNKNTERFTCLNCGTFSDIGPCTCGDCKSHPYKETGLTEKDITEE